MRFAIAYGACRGPAAGSAPILTTAEIFREHERPAGQRSGRGAHVALRFIQSYLRTRRIDPPLDRSLVRILDALLWTSHPASLTYPLIDLIKGWTERSGPTSYH